MLTDKKFVVYLTKYSGNLLPKWYIGSSYEKKVINGYNGSITSKKYKEIYLNEQKKNKHLFKTKILSYHNSDTEAREEELRLQLLHNVVTNTKYFNESYAKKDGFFGMNVDGENHPRFGLKHTYESKKKMKETKIELFKMGILTNEGENNPMFGKVAVSKDDDFIYISQNDLESYLKKGYIMKGKPKSEKMKQTLSKTLTGRKLDDIHKSNIKNSMKGKQNNLGNKHSVETKDKISKNSSDRIWIINKKNGKTKFIKKDIFQQFNDEWIVGRTLKGIANVD